MRCTTFQKCIQCRKVQKCLLMQAWTSSPPNSCVFCISSASLHITADVYVLDTHKQVYKHFSSLSNKVQLRFTPYALLAPRPTHTKDGEKQSSTCHCTHTHLCNQIDILFTWLPHTHKQRDRSERSAACVS